MVVNGAGLAMGTMDLLNDHGLAPANFLDLGGGADEARMASAFEILLDDPDVEILFVNIFGGILSCLAVARAIAKTLDTIVPDRPLVVRFSGFKAQEARAFLKNTENGQLHLVGDIQDALRTLKALTQPSVFSMAENEHESIRTAQDKAFSDIGSDCLGLDQNTPVLVQGMTGRNGALHAELMQRYGTRIVAGVTPGKGGTTSLGVPIYDTVRQALARHEIGAGIIFVPGPFAADAVLEAVEAEIPWVVCITEGIPQMHMIRVLARSAGKKSRIVGPNTPGLILPGRMKLGIMPGEIFHPGPVAVLSRSGTLTYETVHALSGSGIGQSLCLGIGGDPFIGSDFESYLPMLEKCPRTKAVLVLGEIGGQAEERLAAAVKNMGFSKPVLAFIAGRTAPPGKRFGHAGAIIQEGSGGIESKLQALREAGITVSSQLESIVPMLGELMDR
jgi:succinyl-CoA synthetase alpha subunit